MAEPFTPPPVSAWQGPSSSGGFTPPPVTSWQGPATSTVDPNDAILQKMAEQSGGGVSSVLPGPISQFFGTMGSDLNPITLGKSLLHPYDTLKSTFGPGAWMTPEEGVKRGAEVPIPEIAGHAASVILAHQLPSIIKGTPEVARKVGPVVSGAAKGGWEASKAPSTFKFRGMPVELPVPAALSSAGVGYEIGRHIPFVNPEVGGAVGGAIGSVVPGIRGAYRGAMNVLRPPEMPPPGGGTPHPGAPPAAPTEPVINPPPPGVDPGAWEQLTPEIRDAIYRGAASRRGSAPAAAWPMPGATPEPAAPTYSTTTPENISIIPEGEHNIIRKVAEVNRGNKDMTIARSLKDRGITREALDKMPDTDLKVIVKDLGYKPSYGKNYSRTWDAFRRDLRQLIDPGSKLNPP